MEGAAIGGLALGAFGAYFGGGMCGMGDGGGKNCALATLTGFLSGASVGATIGGIIGSAKKKISPAPTDTGLAPVPGVELPTIPVRADSALFPRARSHGGNGAALGAVLLGSSVAVVTALGCAIDQSGEETNCSWKALKRGAVWAVVGGIAGAFVGTVVSPGPRDP